MEVQNNPFDRLKYIANEQAGMYLILDPPARIEQARDDTWRQSLSPRSCRALTTSCERMKVYVMRLDAVLDLN